MCCFPRLTVVISQLSHCVTDDTSECCYCFYVSVLDTGKIPAWQSFRSLNILISHYSLW
jgi:hypothetical protein